MADQPPPYPGGDEKSGAYPPQPQPAYPPQPQPGYPPQAQGAYPPQPQGAYPPPQAGYQPPPQQGYGPPQKQPGGYGPPPQQGYQQQQGQTTVVVAQPTMPMVIAFSVAPVRTSCPHCRADVVTAIHYESGTLSWLLCVILCIIGCNLGCCLIPFCVEGCQDVIHSCPNCHQQIGRWARM